MIFIFVFSGNLVAQNEYSIEGKLIDSKTGEPLPYVSVYLSQTTIGTSTDETGRYRMNKIPRGKYYLIASIVGYKSEIREIDLNKSYQLTVDFSLERILYQMNQIDVTGEIPTGWKHQLQFFKEIFFGNNQYAKKCTIKNEYKLDFQESEVQFQASASEPLQIVNNALSYKIICVLKKFIYDKKKRRVTYEIYPNFIEIIPSTKDSLEDIISNRKDAYLGSVAHLISSLASRDAKFRSEGFELTYLRSFLHVESASEIVSYNSETDQYFLNPSSGFQLRTGRRNSGLIIDYWRAGKKNKSQIDIYLSDGIEFGAGGYIFSNEYQIHGDMAKEGIATMLPLFWKVPE